MTDVFSFYDAWAETYDDPDFLVACEQPLTLTLCGECAGSRVLEIGAGTGRITMELLSRGATVTAIEPTPNMRACLTAKAAQYIDSGSLRVVAQELREVSPVEDGFDLVVVPMVVDHLDDVSEVFRLADRALAPWGVLVVSCVNPYYQLMVRRGLVCRGDQRNASVTGAEATTIEAHCHSFSELFAAGRDSGFIIDDLREATVDAMMATTFPEVSSQTGYHVVYAARFVRHPSTSGSGA